MGAHVSASPNHKTGRTTPLKTRGVVAMAGTFGYELDINKMTDEDKEIVKDQIEFYKKYYDTINYGDYYRLSNPYTEEEFVAWQFVSEDQKQSLISFVQTQSKCNAADFYIKPQGLKEEAIYQVKIDGKDLEHTPSGLALMNGGLMIPVVPGDYPACQIEIQEL